MPVARLPKLFDRTSGVLLHPTSLAGGREGGQLDAEARAFVDFMAAAGQSWWQMLPVGPTGYANSPYSAQSAFAGNPALVAVDRLVEDGLLTAADRGKPHEAALRAAPLRDRDPHALIGARVAFADEIAFVRFVQWRFARDWRALRDYAHER